MFRLSANIYFEEEEDGTIIVDVSRGKFFELNQVSHEILKLITQDKSEQEIADIISLKYNADAERVSRDVQTFVGKLTQMGIIEIC